MKLPAAVEKAWRNGWSVFPCNALKKPMLPEWKPLQQRSPTEQEMQTWAKKNPAGWALVTGERSGIVILDFDGEEGKRVMKQLGLEPHVRTGRGGHHVYFKHPGFYVPSLNSKTSAVLKKNWPGLDTRGDGGYALFWGHNRAGEYKWLVKKLELQDLRRLPFELKTDCQMIPPAPNGSGSHPATATAPQTTAADPEWLLGRALEMAPGDGRHNGALWLACQLRDNNISQSQAEGLMQRYHSGCPGTNTKGERVPYSVADAMRCIRDAYARPARSPIERTPRAGAQKPASNAAVPKPKETPAAKPKPFVPPSEDEIRLKYTGKTYEATPRGLVYWKPTREGTRTLVQLSNFNARITADLVMDDGAETTRAFKIEAEVRKQKRELSIVASMFTAMNWPAEQLGASAIIFPNLKDHARTAIQRLSGLVDERHVYRHIGWRKVKDQWFYLHGAGAIGAKGLVDTVEVELSGSLANYALPSPPSGRELVKAIHASMRMLDVAPDRLTFPMHSAIWRAVIGSANFSIHLSGHTGTGKSQLAALAQQHFGRLMDGNNLPASWTSTSNSLESLAFEAKDALLVVDDFVPQGNAGDVQKMHRDADRLLRAQGNSAGRQRMRADTTLRPAKPPRGLIVSTGEDVPKGQSLRARLVILEFGPNEMRWNDLTTCQEEAIKGLYAAACAGFMRWFAQRFDELKEKLQEEFLQLRQDALTSGFHRRTPDNIAALALGFKTFLSFAVDSKAVTKEEAAELWERAMKAYEDAAAHQLKEQETADPCEQFKELLVAALASGRAHLQTPSGELPCMPSALGWAKVTHGTGRNAREAWTPTGPRIGWIDDDDVYIEPKVTWPVVQQMARDSGEFIPVSLSTLKRRLSTLRHVIPDRKRESVTWRKRFEGKDWEVLVFTPGLLGDKKPDKPDDRPQTTESCRVLSSGFSAILGQPDDTSTTNSTVDSKA